MSSTSHWKADTSADTIIKKNGEIFVSPKHLNITWGNDPRFWQWKEVHEQESVSDVAVQLLQVNWIEVTGKLDFSVFNENETYDILYLVKFKPDAFGWQYAPVKFKVITTDGPAVEVSEMLDIYTKEPNKTHEINGGHFKVSSTSKEKSVQFGVYETESSWWKGSMILEGVKMKPRSDQ